MYIGLDVHKRMTVASCVDEEGNVAREEKFLTNVEEFDSFIESLDSGDEVVLEASTSGMFAYERFEDAGMNVKVAHPQQVKAIASAKVKTDQVDSEVLAQLLRMNYLPEAHVPPQHTRNLRVLVRHRVSLVRVRTQLKNKVHALLAREGVKTPYKNVFGVKGKVFLRDVELKPARKHALNQLIDGMEAVNQLVDETTRLLDEHAQTMPEVGWLSSIPGVGTYTALVILAEVGDIHRFPSPETARQLRRPAPAHKTERRNRKTRRNRQAKQWFAPVGARTIRLAGGTQTQPIPPHLSQAGCAQTKTGGSNRHRKTPFGKRLLGAVQTGTIQGSHKATEL